MLHKSLRLSSIVCTFELEPGDSDPLPLRGGRAAGRGPRGPLGALLGRSDVGGNFKGINSITIISIQPRNPK